MCRHRLVSFTVNISLIHISTKEKEAKRKLTVITVFNSDYDEIKCENSNLLAFTYEGGIGVYYDFKIEVLDELPNYMKDFGAMLMKKIFIRMREYILNDLDRSN